MAKGYPHMRAIGHPHANCRGCVHAHIIVAERALGRFLPEGAEVHHVDEDKGNFSNSNLVICQDAAYHRLLHFRARIVRAGGNPNTDRVCCKCHLAKPADEFARRMKPRGFSDTRAAECKSCSRAVSSARRKRVKANAVLGRELGSRLRGLDT